jgi:protein-disulfide isomerase
MKKILIGALVGVLTVGGYFLGRELRQRGASQDDRSAVTARRDVPLGGDARGPEDAPINIVAFSDFECPFCRIADDSLNKLQQEYGNQIRLFFRHAPMPSHQRAGVAAQAALAAGAQGRFWQMHDQLFAHQASLARIDIDRYAQQIGLEMTTFRRALDGQAYQTRLAEDMALARSLGVRGLPAVFINGRLIVGAKPYGEFKTVVEDELRGAKALAAAGVEPANIYRTLMAGAAKLGAPERVRGATARPAERPLPDKVYKVDVGKAPARGPEDALLTIIEYSDFECPFCRAVEPTIKTILAEYPGKVRVVWKDSPLPSHRYGLQAAIVGRVAHAQGKFWKWHDRLLMNQEPLNAHSLEGFAREIGLDGATIRGALADRELEAAIREDVAAAQKIGVRGTPAFFINGVYLAGAQPLEAFRKIVETQIGKAEALVRQGVATSAVYDEIMKTAQVAVR